MTLRRRILYRGHVQGVGFRATAHSIAAAHAVGGYVRNLPDGGVELVIEGEPAEVQAVQDELARRMSGHIRESTALTEAPTGDREFRIAR
jgi:acylphosphatase